MSSPGVTFNLTYGKGVTEPQNLASLRLSSFAESHQMQQKNFDVSPKCDSLFLLWPGLFQGKETISIEIIIAHTYDDNAYCITIFLIQEYKLSFPFSL